MSFELWMNWARNLQVRAEVVAPKDKDGLCDAVRQACEPGEDGRQRRVRVTGGGFSWAPLVPNGDTIIKTQHLDRVIRIDKDEMTAEVECGVTIGQLSDEVGEHGMTLITPTLFPRPTIGGVIATGCHGTSRLHGNFSDNIIEMTIVKQDGTPVQIDCNDPDFPAAQVALGTLGVVYSVKLRLQRQFNVYVEKRRVPIHEVLRGMENLCRTNDSVEIFWWPFRSTMFVYTMNRTASLPDKNNALKRYLQGLNTLVQMVMASTVLPWLAAHAPNFTPILTLMSHWFASQVGIKVQTASEAFHFQKVYLRCWDMSYAFPAEHAAQAWKEGIDLVNHYAETGLYPVNLALHGRFTGPSTGWLSPEQSRGLTAYVEAVTIATTPHWSSFFKELEGRWLAIDGARPHWSKIYFKQDEIAARYPKLDDFREVRDRWDPQRAFLNDFLEQTLFPRAAGASASVPAPDASPVTEAPEPQPRTQFSPPPG